MITNIPLVFFATVAAVTVILLCHRVFITWIHRYRVRSHRNRHSLIEFGSEWEEIYVPGDRIIKSDYNYEEYDDDL
ncbi:MAG: hypothetical protein K2O88_10165 [Paramuribaculum sp.]|nr:hypothetical protein [Paramuribaculum sp.]